MATKKKTRAKKTAPKTKKKATPKPTATKAPQIKEVKPNLSKQPQSFNIVVVALVLVVAVMGYMRFKHLFVPATVNGSPIFSWEYVKVLHQTSGKQVLDQLVVEKLIEKETNDKNVTLAQEEIDAEFERLEAQFEAVGGLDAFLSGQGLSKKDIQKQLELNLKVQKILAADIEVTDKEIEEYYKENGDLYEDMSEEEAILAIGGTLFDQKLQQQIGVWIQDLRAKAQVTINLPNATQ
ncbi:hypothetical protein ACFL1M_02645 [Patescibacteria group bacterium]